MSATTLSLSGLCNNIGAYLLRHGDVSEATTYLNSALQDSKSESQRGGLVWFLRKLEKQTIVFEEDDDIITTTDGNERNDGMKRYQRSSSYSLSSCRSYSSRRRSSSNSFLDAAPLQLSLSRRSMNGIVEAVLEADLHHDVPLCNENTPLGFEYFHESLFVDTDDNDVKQDSNNDDVRVAAYINLASIQYANAKSSQDVQQVLQALRKAETIVLSENNNNCTNNKTILTSRLSFLITVLNSNIGVCLSRLSNPREALKYFEVAYKNLSKALATAVAAKTTLCKEDGDHNKTNHDDDVYIQRLYAHVTVLLNYARSCIRMNNLEKTASLLKELEADYEKVPHHYHHQHCYHHINAIFERIRWICGTVSKLYLQGMVYQRKQQFADAYTLYRDFLIKARHELGHDHMHVATVLYYKGMVLFEQRKLQHAMLAQLASLRIHESKNYRPTNLISPSKGSNNSVWSPINDSIIDNRNHNSMEEMARVLYSCARTLHDREEYSDALRMYTRALESKKGLSPGKISYDVVTIMCNLARIHYIIGDVDAALQLNYQIVMHAKHLTGYSSSKNRCQNAHPFVKDRLVILGNVCVEAGQMHEAVKAFADAQRMIPDDQDLTYSPASPYDVDGRAAASLAKAGLQHPCAALA